MNYRSNVAAIACLSVIGIGITGCGGGGGGGGVVETGKVQPTVVDEAVAKKALVLLFGNNGLSPNRTANSAVSEKKEKALPENAATRIAARMKKFKISDSLLAKAKGARPAASGNDSGSTSQTYDCAVSGTVTLDNSWVREDAPDGRSHSETYKLTFDECIDTEEYLYYYVGGSHEESYSGSLFHSNGMFGWTWKSQGGQIGHEESEEWFAEDLATDVKIGDGSIMESFSLNGTFKWTHADTPSNMTEKFMGNMLMDEKWYNEDGTVDEEDKWEAIDFYMEYKMSDVFERVTVDGYIGYTETEGEVPESAAAETLQSEGYTWYLYGDEFALTYSPEEGSEPTGTTEIIPEFSVDIEGVLGADCLDGSVAFSTPSVWMVDMDLPDINASDANGSTPYAGSTVISGAGGTSAIVAFDVNSTPEAYGTITVDGVESDPTTLPAMIEGINCNSGIWFWMP